MPTAPIRLNEKLYISIPLFRTYLREIEDPKDKTKTITAEVEEIYAYVHSAPVSREVFEAHYMLFSRVFNRIYTDGLGEMAGPRVAALVLRDVAKEQREYADQYTALINEIRRLTNVLLRTENGWETIPFASATSLLDDQDVSEVENAIVHFTVSSAMHRKNVAKTMLTGAASLWGAEISSSDFTVIAASLKTSTTDVPSGVNQRAALSVPR